MGLLIAAFKQTGALCTALRESGGTFPIHTFPASYSSDLHLFGVKRIIAEKTLPDLFEA